MPAARSERAADDKVDAMPHSDHRRASLISRRRFLRMGLAAATASLLSSSLSLSAHSDGADDQYSGGAGYVIRGVNTNARRICLTIDDLWSEYYTLQICREFHRRNISLTLFPVGHAVNNNLERPTAGHKNLYPRLRDMGHEFGCHLYTHRVIKGFSVDQLIDEEMEPSLRVMRRALGANFMPVGIRPPYGHITDAVKELSQRYNTPLILWGLDSQDAICTHQKDVHNCECPDQSEYAMRSHLQGYAPTELPCDIDHCARECVKEILHSYESYLRPGSIILHHALKATLLAIPAIVDLLDDWNMKAIPLSELLTYSSGSSGA